MEKKVTTSIDELCRGCPAELKNFMHYSRSLRFEARPDYKYLDQLFKSSLDRCGFENDCIFDWETADIETD